MLLITVKVPPLQRNSHSQYTLYSLHNLRNGIKKVGSVVTRREVSGAVILIEVFVDVLSLFRRIPEY
jgi:hypothetical protein